MNRNILVGTHIVVPILLIFLFAYISFSNPSDLSTQSWIVSSLMIYYPIMFFLQGAVCSLLRANIFISLGFSLAAYVIALLIWMNSSAIGYIFAYLIIGFLGFGITWLFQKAISYKTRSDK